MKRLASLVLFVFAAQLHTVAEPLIGGVLRHEGAHEIAVVFTEPVDASSLVNSDNYSIAPGSISTIRIAATNQGAILRVSGLSGATSGILNISGVLDPSGNLLPAASLEFDVTARAWVQVGDNELGFRSEVVGVPENGFDLFNGGVMQRDHYDDATYVAEQFSGDFDARVRVEYVEPAGAGAKAGIMIRESLDENKQRPVDPFDPAQAFSRYVELAVSAPVSALNEPNSAHQIWQRAEFPSMETLSLAVTNDAPPAFPDAWLRVVRIGNEFKMYRGTDGANWTQISGASFNPPLATNVYVGVAFSASNNDIPPETELRKSFVAKFRDYQLTTPNEVGGNISIQHRGDHAEVTWDGWTLQTAPTVLGPWDDLTTATSPLRVNFTDPKRFYRLKK